MTTPAARAAELRADREAVVADVASGVVSPAGLGDDPRAAPVKVVVLAQAVPGVGKVASRRLLDELGIDHDTRWGEIPPADLERLVTDLIKAGGASPAAGR